MIQTTRVGDIYVEHDDERSYRWHRDGGDWKACDNNPHKSLKHYVENVIDEQLHDLDPGRVRAWRRCLAELARARNTETYDIGSPLYGLDGSSRGTSEAEREAA
jgi:hypothetical protein